MAKEPAKENAPAKPAAPAPGNPAPADAARKKGSPMKVVVLVVAVLLLEAGTVVVTMMMTAGPDKAKAHGLTEPKEAPQEVLVELLVAKEQFSNQKAGRVMLYDTEVYITVARKDGDKVKKQIESMQAQLSTDIATVFRRAEPAHFLEPTLATLTRQVRAAIEEKLGKDAEGHSPVREAFIKKCIGFQAS